MKIINILALTTLALTVTPSNSNICKGGGGNRTIENSTIIKIAGGSGGKNIVNS